MLGRGRVEPGSSGCLIHLADTLQRMKNAKLSDDSSSDKSAKEKSESSASGNSAKQAPAVGIRRKLKQFLTKKKKEESISELPSSDTSSSSDFEGAYDSDVEDATCRCEYAVGTPIKNKQRGTEGRTFDVAVNCVKIKRQEGKGVFDYRLDFEPNIDSIKLRRELLSTPEVMDVIGDVIDFNGLNIYLPIRLPEDTYAISTTLPHDGTDVTVTIKFVKEPASNELTTFFYMMFKRIMRELRLVRIRGLYCEPNMKIDIPQHKLEMWPGYVTHVQDFDGGLMLKCDVSYRVLRTSNAREVLQEILKLPDGRSNFVEYAKKRICGAIVLTRYNNKTYQVHDVVFGTTPQSEFTLSNGSKITYMEYFKRRWNIDINDPQQPMLGHFPRWQQEEVPSNMICLVPELSYLTHLIDEFSPDFQIVKELTSHTRVNPSLRLQILTEFIRNVNSNEVTRKILSDWGLALEEHPLSTQARQIPGEQIFFGNGKSIMANSDGEWANDVRNSNLLQPIPVERWVIVFTRRDSAKAEEFVRMLQQVSRNMGFQFANPRKAEINDDTPFSYCNAIKHYAAEAQLVVSMIPGSSERNDCYMAIKKLCFCDLAVSSQVVRANHKNYENMREICQNIALKITCKLGGQLWSVKIPFQSCMIVGMAVYRDPTIKSQSAVGMVASVNQTATRWYTRIYCEDIYSEAVPILQTGMIACLKKYYETTNTLPTKIFIFRDGVSDSQLVAVRDSEIPQMENGITDFVKTHKGPRPLVSMIVVRKQSNLKILMRNPETNGFDNPPPGSVIDDTVTTRQFYDFYLVPQHVKQGTVTPTHFITVYDKNELTPDRMQRFTYKMMHLYYNIPSTIWVPAPCLYAHKAAAMFGQNIKKAPCEALCDKLFYL